MFAQAPLPDLNEPNFDPGWEPVAGSKRKLASEEASAGGGLAASRLSKVQRNGTSQQSPWSSVHGLTYRDHFQFLPTDGDRQQVDPPAPGQAQSFDVFQQPGRFTNSDWLTGATITEFGNPHTGILDLSQLVPPPINVTSSSNRPTPGTSSAELMELCTVGVLEKPYEWEHLPPPAKLEYEQNFGMLDAQLQDINEGTLLGFGQGVPNLWPRYEVCFGMLEDVTMTCGNPPQSKRPVRLELWGGQSIFVYERHTSDYLGLISKKFVKPLVQILEKYRVHIDAFILPKYNGKFGSRHSLALQLILYGLREYQEDIGDVLGAADLYLQRPFTFNDKVQYCNPQLLFVSDDDFGSLDDRNGPEPNSDEVGTYAPKSHTFRASQKQLANIFDCAEGPKSFEPVKLSSRIKTPLKCYQEKALSMMIEKERGLIEGTCFGSIYKVTGTRLYQNLITGRRYEEIPPQSCRGGLLADDMGLGKSLTTLALIATTLDSQFNITGDGPQDQGHKNCTLIVTPRGTLDTWDDQLRSHLEPQLRVHFYHGDQKESDINRLIEHDVVITTYDTLRVDYFKGRNKGEAKGVLHSIQWLRVVLDEAHIIRNSSSKMAKATNSLEAKHRWCLTGTPIQNRIEDFGSLLRFLRVDPFQDSDSFEKYIAGPLRKAEKDATKRLRLLVNTVSLRRTKASVGAELDLPSREDRICNVKLTEGERDLYELCRDNYWVLTGGKHNGSRKAQHGLLQCLLRLRQICNHGKDLLPRQLQQKIENHLSVSLGRATSDIVLSPAGSLFADQCDSCALSLSTPEAVGSRMMPDCSHIVCHTCILRMETGGSCSIEDLEDTQLDHTFCPACSNDSGTRASGISPFGSTTYPFYTPSSKVNALIANLQAESNGESFAETPCKSVIFSCWTGMLNLVQHALELQMGYKIGINVIRLDGSTSTKDRRSYLELFRTSPSCTILLASIETAGVGIDLTIASRVHLLEPQWNPMTESQALDRIHRIGQKRSVVAIRYIVEKSVEEHLANVQQRKIDLIKDSLGAGSDGKSKWLEEALREST